MGFFWGWKQFNGPRGRALTQNQVEKERWDNYGGRIGARPVCSAWLTGCCGGAQRRCVVVPAAAGELLVVLRHNQKGGYTTGSTGAMARSSWSRRRGSAEFQKPKRSLTSVRRIRI